MDVLDGSSENPAFSAFLRGSGPRTAYWRLRTPWKAREVLIRPRSIRKTRNFELVCRNVESAREFISKSKSRSLILNGTTPRRESSPCSEASEPYIYEKTIFVGDLEGDWRFFGRRVRFIVFP